MRVPIYITIPACIVLALLVWWIGTMDKDFITSPTQERFAEISQEWEKSRPRIPPPQPINAALLKTHNLGEISPTTKSKPKKEKPAVGNLLISPSLAEYETLGEKVTQTLIQLATFLESKKELPHALLAWERVIDSSNPEDQQRQQAVEAIQRLRSTIPPWNLDPSADITITLHTTSPLEDQQNLHSALDSIAELITRSSGYLLKVNTKASFRKTSDIQTQDTPVVLWFSRPNSQKNPPLLKTRPISLFIDPEHPEILSQQLMAGVYTLLRDHLAKETNFSRLPEYTEDIPSDKLLKYYVTRLMWREFAKSIQQ